MIQSTLTGSQAIILAGGLGTRLRETVPSVPKCMAPVAGRPFLFYVINYLRMQGIQRFVFSLGYRHEMIQEYLGSAFETLQYECVIEDEPLGTGGAIRLAAEKAETKNVWIANGDTLFKADLENIVSVHEQEQAECTIALKHMKDFDRYGVVELNPGGVISSFHEKKFYKDGTINAGLYLLNRKAFISRQWPEKFSFEKDYLEKLAGRFYGATSTGYFIDIGIPEDYNRAQKELQQPPLDISKIDRSWTLFLDRDGVINLDKEGSYIFNPGEFIFDKGAPALFKKLSSLFGRIIVVTNQRGVGRGLMTEMDLRNIHDKMKKEVAAAAGRIDAVYYCTATNNDHPNRKPNPGMAADAKNDFPEIDFARSIMVGNNKSDMAFGRNAGMYTVFLKTTKPDKKLPDPDIDLAFSNLEEFTRILPG